MKVLKYFVLLLVFSSCGKYNVNHYGCDDPPVNEKFDGGYLFMPNIFTPNEDGIDDFLFIVYRGATNINLKIKNDLNEIVFEEKNLENRGFDGGIIVWDGRVKKMIGNIYHTNNYHYELSFTMPSGESKIITNRLTVVTDGSKEGGPIGLGCIRNFNNCVFESQWVSDSLPLRPVDSTGEYQYYGSCK